MPDYEIKVKQTKWYRIKSPNQSAAIAMVDPNRSADPDVLSNVISTKISIDMEESLDPCQRSVDDGFDDAKETENLPYGIQYWLTENAGESPNPEKDDEDCQQVTITVVVDLGLQSAVYVGDHLFSEAIEVRDDFAMIDVLKLKEKVGQQKATITFKNIKAGVTSWPPRLEDLQ